MKEKCYYHYIIKDTIKPPLSQETWEVFSLFFKKSPPKEQAFVRLSHPKAAKAPPTGPQAEEDVGPPFSGKRERAPALSLSSPSMSAQLTLGVGRLLKGIHPPFRPIACPGKAAGPGSSPQKPIGSHAPNRPTDSPGRASRSGRQPANPTGPHRPHRPTDSPGRANPAGPGGSPQKPEGPHQPFRPTPLAR